jgi:plasmid replication initiation protein
MDKVELEKARNAIVVKSNDLIQKSRFELSTLQQKLVLFLASKINYYDDDFKLHEFSIAEFCSVCGIDDTSGGNYSGIKKAIKEIADKSIWVTLEDGRETLLRWIEKPYVDKNSGIIKIRFDKDMKPFLLKLQDNFTQYELIWTIQFKSKYSIRLYEYLKSIHYNKLTAYERIFTVEEIRKILGAEDVHKEWKNFRARVLEPAIAEINEYSNQVIEYSPMLKGKAVDRVWIKVAEKDYIDAMKSKRIKTEE